MLHDKKILADGAPKELLHHSAPEVREFLNQGLLEIP